MWTLVVPLGVLYAGASFWWKKKTSPVEEWLDWFKCPDVLQRDMVSVIAVNLVSCFNRRNLYMVSSFCCFRWASGRRGGMTVLGKVAAPKPLNLPSQRLENHGLDPNVEIVPKGTLSWGSRFSSSASNAWGSSTQCPSPDGGTGSPSHLSGCPSSGGSGTRPSTAGSDRMQEASVSAWGPNSRPSSASGLVTSNQTSLTSLRPRSAETRPGSSQLSRFAELSSDKSAWVPTAAVEKLGVSSSKNDGFSLSSGDFPTLGSERDNSGKNMESEGDVSFDADINNGPANTWKRDGPQHIENGVQPSMEKWQGDSQQYPNVPPQHFDAWHGPPMNAPPAVWYRGPPGVPPYGTPVAPGGFPIEPFPYYHPQIPHPVLSSSQPVPPAGGGPRGAHPKNGDLCRPLMPDAYMRPGMPIRPSFYPGPVAYEGYYGPPMGYCSSNERDFPFRGMAATPSVYSRYPAQNDSDPGNTHAKLGEHGYAAKTLASEPVKPGHSDDTQGPHKVLLKQPNEWDGKEEVGNQKHTAPANASSFEKGDQPRTLSWKNEWGAETRSDEEMYTRRTMTVGENSSRTFDNRGSSSGSAKVNIPENRGNARLFDESWVKKSGISPSSSPKASQLFPATPKDSTFIKKIEGGQHDVASTSSREEQKNRLMDVNAKFSSYTNEAGIATVERTCTTGNLIPASLEVGVSSGDKTLQPTAASGATISRRGYHGVQGRIDHHGKVRLHTHDVDGWRKKPLPAETFGAISAASFEPTSDVRAQDCHDPVKVASQSEMKLPAKDEGESLARMFDPGDCQAQRAKSIELAKQRAIQRQKQEEERTREQKAKALAKLEELNQRAHARNGSTQKWEKDLSTDTIQREQEESHSLAEPVTVATNCEAPSSDLIFNSGVVPQVSGGSSSGVEESTALSKDSLLETPNKVQQEPVIPHGKSLPLKQEVDNGDAADTIAASQVNDSVVSKHKRMDYKQKHNMSLEKKLVEKSTRNRATEAPKNHVDVVVNDVPTDVVPVDVGSSGESRLPNNSSTMAESSALQRRKNNWSGKNKHKLDDVSSAAALSSPVSNETNPPKAPTESGKAKVSNVESDPCSVQSVIDAKDAIQSSEQCSSLPREESHGRVNNQLKSQHSRRMPRNQQVNRSVDKYQSSDAVIWAPVRSQNKAEFADEASQRTMPDVLTTSSKSDNSVQNNMKSKRAEMERYVPKPVAKELAQQGSFQQPVSATTIKTTSDEMTGSFQPGSLSNESSQPASCTIGNVEPTLETKNGDSRQNKQAKTYGAWRQRSSTESSRLPGLQHGSSSISNPSNTDKHMEQLLSLKPDENIVKAQQEGSDEWNTSDGNTPHASDAAAPIIAPVGKNQGAMGKGKRHPFKGNRSSGTYHKLDHKNIDGEEMNKSCIQSASFEAYSANTQLGSRSSGGHHVNAEAGRAKKKDSPLPPQNDKASIEVMAQPLHDLSVPGSKKVAETSNVGQQEARGEREAGSFKERPYSPNEGPVSTDNQDPANVDSLHERRFYVGFRKNGNPNNHSSRGHESGRDWSYADQDNRHHNTPVNRGRQRHNSHYGYQPVGPTNDSKSENFEGPRDGSHNVALTYRERGSKRGGGNFYGRQSGTVQVDAGYD
ncbi:unnamed protein product [Ilex paraguariensis]|uniref:BAT2 N-terminal domain-containing protein n=1 Tax=Ilex paraguariensis TaxID=185542 RepID=A0ABC8R0V2_9AQUA